MNPYLLLAALVSIATSGFLGYRHGLEVQDGRHKAELFEQATAYAKEVLDRQAVADSLSADIEAARSAQKPKDRIIIKEVTKYAYLTPLSSRCNLDANWRLLHDAAATGTPPNPETSGLSDGEAGPVTDAAALETVAENYADCREWRARLIGLQEFFERLRHP